MCLSVTHILCGIIPKERACEITTEAYHQFEQHFVTCLNFNVLNIDGKLKTLVSIISFWNFTW